MLHHSHTDSTFLSNAVGRAAFAIRERAALEWQGRLPTPSEVSTLILPLLQMLYVCQPDPYRAMKYLHIRRLFRLSRIEKEVAKQMRTAFPKYSEKAVDLIVRSVLVQCQICRREDVADCYAVVKGSVNIPCLPPLGSVVVDPSLSLPGPTTK